MSNNLFAVPCGTTGRCIYKNVTGFPHVRIFNAGATDAFLRASSMSSGSSESTGFCLKSSQYSHDFQLYPGDELHCFTTNSTCTLQVHVWGDCTGTTGPLSS